MNSTPTNRRELRASHAKLATALQEEAECVAAVNRLRATIEEGQAAKSKAVAGLLASKGVPAGESSEASQSIAQVHLARLALPQAKKDAKAASEEVTRLRKEVLESAKAQLISDAGTVISEYRKRIEALCETFDELVDIKGALIGEAGHEALEIPLFRLTPYAESAKHFHGAFSGSGDPLPSALKTQSNWTKALDRLVEDCNSDISDLIGVAA